LTSHGVAKDNVYSETTSGMLSTAQRPIFDSLRARLAAGDTLAVYKLDRLGRSAVDCVTTVDALHKAGVRILTVEDGLDSSTPFGRAMLGILASLAELERETIVSRVRSGMAAARTRGVHCGRHPVATVETARLIQGCQAQGVRVPEIARRLKMSRASVYKALRLLLSGKA
jgi:DNA invertase Pin-like site-specific DNA recombinase